MSSIEYTLLIVNIIFAVCYALHLIILYKRIFKLEDEIVSYVAGNNKIPYKRNVNDGKKSNRVVGFKF